jgi:two-component system sensor histidine kinase KdpD
MPPRRAEGRIRGVRTEGPPAGRRRPPATTIAGVSDRGAWWGRLERVALWPGVRPAIVAAAFGLSTAIVALLEVVVEVRNASAVYLLPVITAAVLVGTRAAVAMALVAVVIYDLLFTQPRLTLTISDPGDWYDLAVFVLVAIAVGRLVALLAVRATEAARRATEAQASFAISRSLATESELESAVAAVLDRLAVDAGLERAWVTVGDEGAERLLADTRPDHPRPVPGGVATLARTPGDEPARWVRTRDPVHRARPAGVAAAAYRIKLDATGDLLGSLWAVRLRDRGEPSREETRLLALAADQLALAVRRDSLGRAATGAEIARQSDRLKSALLDSVSHDLRTPLASIRAAAGGLMDPAIEPTADERRAAATAIDLEAQRLDRLVRDLLDVSRIQSGALRPDLEAWELPDLVDPVVARFRSRVGDRDLRVELPEDLPPVRADALLVEQILDNLLENALRYAPPAAVIRIAAAAGDGLVTLTVEDGGEGVPAPDLPHLFERFYRVAGSGRGSRRGLGLGLSIVEGLARAMEGSVTAAASSLGGLAVRVELPAAEPPREAE